MNLGELGNNDSRPKYEIELEPEPRRRRRTSSPPPIPFRKNKPKRKRKPQTKNSYKPKASQPPRNSQASASKPYEELKSQLLTEEKYRTSGLNKFVEALYKKPATLEDVLKKVGCSERQQGQLKSQRDRFLKKLTTAWATLVKEYVYKKEARAVIRCCSFDGQKPPSSGSDWRKLGYNHRTGAPAVCYQIASLHDRIAEFEEALVAVAGECLPLESSEPHDSPYRAMTSDHATRPRNSLHEPAYQLGWVEKVDQSTGEARVVFSDGNTLVWRGERLQPSSFVKWSHSGDGTTIHSRSLDSKDGRHLVNLMRDSSVPRDFRERCYTEALRLASGKSDEARLHLHAALEEIVEPSRVLAEIISQFLKEEPAKRDLMEKGLVKLCTQLKSKNLLGTLPEALATRPAFQKFLPVERVEAAESPEPKPCKIPPGNTKPYQVGCIEFFDPAKDCGKVRLQGSAELKFNSAALKDGVKANEPVVVSERRGNYAHSIRPIRPNETDVLLSIIQDKHFSRSMRVQCLDTVLKSSQNDDFKALLFLLAVRNELVLAEDAAAPVARHFLRGETNYNSLIEKELVKLCSQIPEQQRFQTFPEELWSYAVFRRYLDPVRRFPFEVGHLSPEVAAGTFASFSLAERRQLFDQLLPDAGAMPWLLRQLREDEKFNSLKETGLLPPDAQDRIWEKIVQKRKAKAEREARRYPKQHNRSNPRACGESCDSDTQKRRPVEKQTPSERPGTIRLSRGNWSVGFALGYYAELRPLIHPLKYGGDPKPLEEIVQMAHRLFKNGVMKGAGMVDFIVPIPPTLRRGFQPVEEFCFELSKALGVPLVKALRKNRTTRPQKGEVDKAMNIEEKIRNMKDAFEVASVVQGKRILLVDDIFDSGVTLLEATHVLRTNGADKVSVLAMAALRSSRFSVSEFMDIRSAKDSAGLWEAIKGLAK